jgi:hypothetical protein
MGKTFFYGRAKVRDVAKLDITTGQTHVVFSTQVRPSGTKVEDPEEGTRGNNSAEHNPPTHVTLYQCPGGTGEADSADPLKTWNLIETADSIAAGLLVPICNGYLLKEWSVCKGDSEGGETIERRFAVEIVTNWHKPVMEQGLGLLGRHSAALTVAVLETQAEFDDMPAPNKKPTRKAKKDPAEGQPNLFTAELDPPHETTMAVMTLGPQGLSIEFPDQEPQDPDGVQPTWDFTTFSTGKLLRILEDGAATPDYLQAVQAELNSRPVEIKDAAQDLLDSVADQPDAAAVLPEQAESMIDKASKARRRK